MVGRKQWLLLGLGLALAAAAARPARADSIETAGTVLQIAIPAIGYATTFALDDGEGRTQFYKSFATDIAVVYALKYAVHKKRPDSSNNLSFPSGHTASAFQGAAFIQRRYGWAWSVPAYLGAVFVGYSRIEAHKHDRWDVAGGALVGTLSSYWFTTPYKSMSVRPLAADGRYGVAVSARW